jgi:diguanylate cyclase (GGDEF)-like protein/PAS domain S-box-containing protein
MTESYLSGASCVAPGKEGRGDRYELLLVKYKLLFDHARDMILFIDKDGKILDANLSALDTYGYTKDEITAMYVFELRQYDSREFVRNQMRQAENASILFETIHRTKSGKIIPVEVSSTGVTYGGQRMLMSIIRDVSAKQEYLLRIKKLAYFDELTGIPNRKSFRDALKMSVSDRSIKFALMLIDVDDFKRVNDTCSHCVGDAFLVEISRRINFGLADRGILYRLGGDEFTILTDPFANRDYILSIVDDIRAALGDPFEIEGTSFRATLSIGISLFPEHDTDEGCLLKKADTAMYRVKERAKDGFAFYA